MPKRINVNKAWLEELYIQQNKSRKETAKILGIKESLIKVKIAKYKLKKDLKKRAINNKKTCLERYGAVNAGGIPSTLEKIKQSNRKRFGYDWCVLSEEVKAKRLKKLAEEGITNVFQRKAVIQKGIATKRKNKTFNTSKPEQIILQLLKKKFENIEYQYISKLYPFACDFYIPKIDLYIEYQGIWTHGKKPYKGTQEDLIKVKFWESKNNKFYRDAINVWTKRDPLKRKTAKENKLNWLEFFNMNQFMEWYNSIEIS